MLIVDDREKWTHKGSHDTHLKKYFDRHGIMYRVQRLDVGDYMLDGGKISVDRKYGLEELAKNLTNRSDDDAARFWNEVRRGYRSGIKLVVLIEQHGITCNQDVASWRSEYTGVTGGRLLQEMFRLEMSYGVRFMFTDRRNCGRRIMEILTTGQ